MLFGESGEEHLIPYEGGHYEEQREEEDGDLHVAEDGTDAGQRKGLSLLFRLFVECSA